MGKNCETCKMWSHSGHSDDKLGICKSNKWNIHPNYYTCSSRETKDDMVEVTYLPATGKNFGCIHHVNLTD